MISEFNWWLLLLGLVVGGGLTWLVMAETRRREQDLEDQELPEEAEWLEARLAEEGRPLPTETIQRVVELHRAYLDIVPPSEGPEDWPLDERVPEAEEPWRTRWEAPALGAPGDEVPVPGLHAPEPTAPEPAAPDETGVRH
jgi:hypothetical protein